MDERLVGAVALGTGAVVLLALAWAIGVLGHVRLISQVRAEPERYPDAAGLGRWTGFTLAASGFSLGLSALALADGGLDEAAVGLWAGGTGAATALLAIWGVARYRRAPAARPDTARRR